MGKTYINNDGVATYVFDNEEGTAIQQGWTPVGDTPIESYGDTFSLSPEDYSRAKTDHFEEAPIDELSAQVLAEEGARKRHFDTPGQKALAVAEGGLSVLTFGGSDWALADLGAKERAKYLEEYRTGGEIVGTLGAALLPGGQSRLARLFAHTPAGAVSKAVMARTAGAGLAATTAYTTGEGALYGVGKAISNAALQDKPFTAEAFLADVGYNSLFGSGFGAAGGAIGYGLAKASRGLSNKAYSLAVRDNAEAIAGDVVASVRGLDSLADDLGKLQAEASTARSFDDALSKPVLDDIAPQPKSSYLDEVDSFEAGNAARQTAGDTVVIKRADVDGLGPKRATRPTAPVEEPTVVGKKRPSADDVDPFGNTMIAPMPSPVAAARDKAAAAFGGSLDTDGIKAALISGKDIMPKLTALDDYYKSVRGLAGSNPDLLAKVEDAFAGLRMPGIEKVSGGISSTDLALAIGAQELPEFDGPVDDLFRWYALLRLGGPALKGSRSPLGKAISRFAGSGLAHGMISPMVKGLPLPLRGVAHGAAGAVGYRVGDKFGNVVFNHTQGLARSTAGVMSRIAGIADKLAKGAKRSGPVAFTAFANLPFSDEPRAKSHKAQVKQQVSEIARAAASPETYGRKMHEVLAPVWESHPEVADEIEAKLVKLPTFLDRVAPKDPGTLFRLGLSLWEPTDVEVAKWEEYIKGAVFPMEVLDDVLSGQVSAQAALAMREMNPEIFRKFQEELLTRVEDIQENASYDQVVGLSVLYDVSLDSTMSKKYRRFMQDLWAKELEQNAAAESGQSQSRSSPEPMTKAQQLLE